MNPDRLKWCRAYLTTIERYAHINPCTLKCMSDTTFEVGYRVGLVGGVVAAPSIHEAVQGAIGAINALLPEGE